MGALAMNSHAAKNTDDRIGVIRAYFSKVKTGDPSVSDLFTDDVEFYFPKFGSACGKQGLAVFAERMGRNLAAIGHNIEQFHYIVSRDTPVIVVEGTEFGKLMDGRTWPDGAISQGRFCSVFEFEGLLISRMSIYVDPDFGSDDAARIAWLRGEAD
jgi:hypothetical protein